MSRISFSLVSLVFITTLEGAPQSSQMEALPVTTATAQAANNNEMSRLTAEVSTLQKELTQLWAEEMNPNVFKTLLNKIRMGAISVCTPGEARKLLTIQTPLVKLLIAFCEALETYSLDLIKQQTTIAKLIEQNQNKLVESLKQCKLYLQQNITLSSQSNNTDATQAQTLFNTIVPDIQSIVLKNYPMQFTLPTNLPSFTQHFNQACKKYLTTNDINELNTFVTSTAYTKFKGLLDRSLLTTVSTVLQQKIGSFIKKCGDCIQRFGAALQS